MAITGTKKEQGSFSKIYGLDSFNVLGVNLSNRALDALGFYVKKEDLDKERKFEGDRDGKTTYQIEFACRSVSNKNRLRRFSFWVEDSYRRNKEDSEIPLYQFINDQGQVAWSEKAKEFIGVTRDSSFFTGRDNSLNPRPAFVGEEEFMLFMRNCMAINWKEGGTLVYNTRKLLSGNLKELKEDLKTDFLSPILVALTIRQKATDEGIKETEAFFPYLFAPGSFYSLVLTKGQFNEDDIAVIHKKEKNNKETTGKRQYVNPLEKLILKMTDSKYGCKDIYHLGVVKEYVSQLPTEEKATVAETEPEEENTSTY